jgi:peptidoglycan hydrolase-like protein with peptidoglycan-binding domain
MKINSHFAPPVSTRLTLLAPYGRVLAAVILIAFIKAGVTSAQGVKLLAPQRQIPSYDPPPQMVLEAEKLLFNLGYWVGPIDGLMDEGSRQALIAFQKVGGHKPEGRLTPGVLRALRKADRPSAKYKGGSHIEVDLSRQILLVVDSGSRVNLVLSVTTGNGKTFTEGGWTRRANTPRGSFTVYRKLDDWRESPLGPMYYPNYIVGGVAIHGSRSVPPGPSTHGCIGIPLSAAKEFSKMTPIGTVVLVYGHAPTPRTGVGPTTRTAASTPRDLRMPPR